MFTEYSCIVVKWVPFIMYDIILGRDVFVAGLGIVLQFRLLNVRTVLRWCVIRLLSCQISMSESCVRWWSISCCENGRGRHADWGIDVALLHVAVSRSCQEFWSALLSLFLIGPPVTISEWPSCQRFWLALLSLFLIGLPVRVSDQSSCLGFWTVLLSEFLICPPVRVSGQLSCHNLWSVLLSGFMVGHSRSCGVVYGALLCSSCCFDIVFLFVLLAGNKGCSS